MRLADDRVLAPTVVQQRRLAATVMSMPAEFALLSFGARLGECLKAADELETLGLSATVADARFMKPLDLDMILKLAREHEVLITIEEGSIGGFGSFVSHLLSEEGLLDGTGDRPLRFRSMVLPDVFLDQDKPEKLYAQAQEISRRGGSPSRPFSDMTVSA